MKRAEIEIGVEYAQHGPMAFGRVPGSAPDKVRFTSTKPNHRIVTTGVVRVTPAAEWSNRSPYRRAEEVGYRITLDYAGLPESRTAAVSGAEDGEVVQWAPPPPSGSLPAERYEPQTDRWVPVLATPSSVHMTWAEWKKAQAEEFQEKQRRARINAPGNIRRAIRALEDDGRLLGLDPASLARLLVSRDAVLRQDDDGVWSVQG